MDSETDISQGDEPSTVKALRKIFTSKRTSAKSA